jgi:hypothetical protein
MTGIPEIPDSLSPVSQLGQARAACTEENLLGRKVLNPDFLFDS